LKKIVILKRPSTDFIDSYLLIKSLRMLRTLFPECEIEIQENPPGYNPDKKIHAKFI